MVHVGIYGGPFHVDCGYECNVNYGPKLCIESRSKGDIIIRCEGRRVSPDFGETTERYLREHIRKHDIHANLCCVDSLYSAQRLCQFLRASTEPAKHSSDCDLCGTVKIAGIVGYSTMSAADESICSKAIGAGIGIGVGIGAGWGIVMALIMDGDISIGITIGAGAGLIIALVSGAAVYYTATADD